MKLLSKRLIKGFNLSNYKPSTFDLEEERVSYDYQVQKNKDEEKNNEMYYLKKELEERIANIEHLEREAYEKGYSVGENAGFEMGLKKAEVVVERFQSLVEELISIKEEYIKRNDRKILALSIAIARKILEKEVKENDEVLLNILHNALKKIERREKITITINPSIQTIIERFKGNIKEICPKIIIDIDPNVRNNFVKIESETEEVIIDFEHELYDISKKLSELI